ncbi:cobyrinic acid a,c-diamide synthase, partial [Geobacillus thermodenitrificans]
MVQRGRSAGAGEKEVRQCDDFRGAHRSSKESDHAGKGERGMRRLVIAAPGSGAGKTTVTLGLMAAMRQQGYTVQGFKCGPDY